MKKAIIYVRGHNKEMQEILCRLYAHDMGYKVLFVTTVIEAVYNCDVLIITNPSRVSRNSFAYHETANDLQEKGIEIEFATDHVNAVNNLHFAKQLLK